MNQSHASSFTRLRRVLLLAVSGLVFTAAAEAADPPVAPLAIGTPVRAEITSADRLNYSDGTRSKLYRFSANDGDALSFAVSGALRAQLTVYADGQPVARSKHVRSEEAEREDAMTTLTWRAGSDQSYVLAVSGTDDRAYGPFQLASQRLDLYNGGTLTPDVTISDLFDGSAREIPVQIETGGLYQIDLRSDAFDTVLELNGNGVSLEDDDGGDGTNSRLLTQLQPGRYTLRARGYSARARGLYTLSVTAWQLPDGIELRNDGALPPDGSELNGMLDAASRRNRYTLTLDARQLVTIDLKSDIFDPYLELDGEGVSERNDDGGDGLNARIRTILQAGTYQVTARIADHANGNRSGAGLFQISARAIPVPEGAGTGAAVTAGQDIGATLTQGIANRHAFRVPHNGGGQYVIDMHSDDVDSYLRLYRGDRQIDSNDDGGESLDARIEAGLEPGEYVIEASSVNGEAGRYQLAVRRR